MLIFDDNSQPIILDNIYGPTPTEYMWVLDLAQRDFMLSSLDMLEETVCPTLTVLIRGFELALPANWNILVYDRETAQLDVVSLSEAAGREFTAFTYGPRRSKPTPELITVTNYFPERTNVGPTLNKHQMLCHPVGPEDWVCVSPSDSFNKYLKDIIVGDLITM